MSFYISLKKIYSIISPQILIWYNSIKFKLYIKDILINNLHQVITDITDNNIFNTIIYQEEWYDTFIISCIAKDCYYIKMDSPSHSFKEKIKKPDLIILLNGIIDIINNENIDHKHICKQQHG